MASPFSPKLGTNYCPKDEEVIEIKNLLVEPTLRLKRLDDEIADLQKAIDKLAAERESLGTYVAAHKALISPVRRLPLDIIQEIFIACIPAHRNCVMSASEPPVLLGRICSSWRAISLSTPRLWTRLHIVEPPRGRYGSSDSLIDEKVAQRLEITKMWLDRSGQCPVSISLQSGPDYDSPPVTPSTSHSRSGQFLQALLPFASRWQHIRFTTPPFVLEFLVDLTAADVPMLETVAFNPQHQFPPRIVKWEQFGMLSSPRITSFSTSGHNFIPDALPLQWHQLTNLTVDGPVWETSMTSEMILKTFANCPTLRTCKLVVNDSGNVELPLSHPAVELPFLHTLELDFGGVISTVPRLLNRLSLPELRIFAFHGHADLRTSLSLAPFFALWTRLEILSIDSNSFSKSSLLESLRSLPATLRILNIHDITHGAEVPLSLDDDALQVLEPRCPALETLVINYCCLITDAALLQFITARMSGEFRTALKFVAVQFSRQMMLDIMPSLQPFMEAGLDISITYLPLQAIPTPFSPWQGLEDAPSPWGPPVYW
jgi:hypothetical protein